MLATTRQKIIKEMEKGELATISGLARRLKISRPIVSILLNDMASSGDIELEKLGPVKIARLPKVKT